MPLTPQELKDKLLRTLDKDYNVVDIAGAKEALSILEKYPITRETLEQTRLGRYVNDMRKKTSDKDFAKRIKNLVRKWQVLVSPGTPSATPADQQPVSEPPPRVNGKAPVNATRLLDGHVKGLIGLRPTSPASRPQTPCSARSSVSSPQSTHGAQPPSVTVSAARRDVTDARDASPVATTLSRCASEVPLSSTRASVVSPLVGHTAVVSQPRVSKQLHSAPTTPLNSTNLLGGFQLTTTVNNVVTSGKRKRDDEPTLPGIKLKIMKKSGSATAAVTTECETHPKDRVPSSTTSASTWSCTSETIARKPPNGMLAVAAASLPAASTPPSSASTVPPPAVKSRRGRPPNSSTRQHDRVTVSSTTTPIVTTLTHQSESTTLVRPDTPSASLPTPTFIPKVSTTAELIEKLHKSGDLRLTASETVRKIASNQIVKETMADNNSVVPASAKPRARKKNSVAQPPSTPDMMTMVQIKNEMVHKFLESSVVPRSASSPPPPTNNSLMNLLKRLDPPPDPDSPLWPSANDHHTSKLSRPHSTSPNRTRDPPDDDALTRWDDLPPPLDPSQIDWSTTEYVAPDPESRPPVTDADVERLHVSQWSGVNGQFDFRNEWSDWTETFSATSYNGDLLHILPYVNIRD